MSNLTVKNVSAWLKALIEQANEGYLKKRVAALGKNDNNLNYRNTYSLTEKGWIIYSVEVKDVKALQLVVNDIKLIRKGFKNDELEYDTPFELVPGDEHFDECTELGRLVDSGLKTFKVLITKALFI